MMNVSEYNRNAWNLQSMEGCRWSTPFEDAVIERAKQHLEWEVILTPNLPVPASWFPSHPSLTGVELLAMASGGGQQVPLFAAAGANVTSYDYSDIQLEKDETTCARHDLSVQTVHGDMADMSALPDEHYDLIFNPVSNVFAKDLEPIWKECYRVLKPGGRLLCGFMNPAFFLFDHYEAEESREFVVRHAIPYSDIDSLRADLLEDHIEAEVSLEFSHTIEGQIGGQCEAGFAIRALYEDGWDDESSLLNKWMKMYIATQAIKI